MHQEARNHVAPLLLAGLFFIIDRILKFIAPTSNAVGNRWIGWEYFENTGIAFSLPVPHIIVAVATPIILILLLAFVTTHRSRVHIWYGWWLLLFGAISNFIDRLLYGFVVDYVRINTGVINIADLMVLVGIVVLYYKQKKPNG